MIAHSVLHHVERLEYAYEQIEQALRPGGLFVINEYIGPNRLQYSDNQLERINAIMKRLPEHLRRSALSGEILTERIRPLSLCKALVLERSEFVATLATQFKKLDVWRDDGEKRSGYQLLFSACSLFAEDLQKETTAKMLSDRLERGGHLIALASVRKPGEVPPWRRASPLWRFEPWAGRSSRCFCPVSRPA